MRETWEVPLWAQLVTLGALVALVVVLVGLALDVRRLRRDAGAAADLATATDLRVRDLEQRLAQLGDGERPPAGTQPVAAEYTITRLGEPDDGAGPVATAGAAVGVVPAPLFADLVLREGVVQAASLAAGLRRALAPETRARIRSEMRREVKRARRERRAELRLARRAVVDARGLDRLDQRGGLDQRRGGV